MSKSKGAGGGWVLLFFLNILQKWSLYLQKMMKIFEKYVIFLYFFVWANFLYRFFFWNEIIYYLIYLFVYIHICNIHISIYSMCLSVSIFLIILRYLVKILFVNTILPLEQSRACLYCYSTCLPAYLFIYLYSCEPICYLSIYLSIYLPIMFVHINRCVES